MTKLPWKFVQLAPHFFSKKFWMNVLVFHQLVLHLLNWSHFVGKFHPKKWGRGNFKTCRKMKPQKRRYFWTMPFLFLTGENPPQKPLRNTTQVVSIPRYDLWNLPPAAFEDDQLGNKGRVRNPFVRPNPPLRNSREISNVGAMVSLVDIKLMDSDFL